MGPARGANVVLADSFTTDVESLRSTYPEIDAVVAELVEFLEKVGPGVFALRQWAGRTAPKEG